VHLLVSEQYIIIFVLIENTMVKREVKTDYCQKKASNIDV